MQDKQDKKETVRTMPEGIWESSRPKQVNGEGGSSAEKTADAILRAQDNAANERAGSPDSGQTDLEGGACAGGEKSSTPDPSLTMDWQGNGYPGQPRSRTASDNS